MYSSSPADAPLVREPLHAPVAHLIRGGLIEGIHYGSVVVLDADGESASSSATSRPRSIRGPR